MLDLTHILGFDCFWEIRYCRVIQKKEVLTSFYWCFDGQDCTLCPVIGFFGFSVFPYLSLSLSEYFWKVQTRVESTVCALWGVGVVCSARGMCGEVVFFSPVSAVLLENEPAANSQVVIWSFVTALPLLPWTTAPRGRDDGLLLINHEPLFLCTDSGLTGNSFWFQVTVWKTKIFFHIIYWWGSPAFKHKMLFVSLYMLLKEIWRNIEPT